MSKPETELTPSQIRKATGLTSSKLRFWSDGTVLNIKPSISSGRQGSTSLYSLGDYYMLTLAQAASIENRASFAAVGMVIDAIARHPDWGLWEENRGLLIARLSAEGVELIYSRRMRDGRLETEMLFEAIQKASARRTGKSTPGREPRKQVVAAQDRANFLFMFDLELILGEADQRLAKILR